MGSNNKSYKNKGEKLNESQYVDKIINHFKSDLIGERIELKKTYSLSTDEYIELLQHEVNLINSLKGEVFDTSDPKWFGTGSYEFTFEIDSSYLYNYKLPPPNENVLFTRESIEVDVDVDVTGTVFLESTMRDNPGRDWTLREAIENRHMGHIIISEIRDIIYTILEQRLPLLKNLETLDVCNVKEEWVTKLSNVDKNINEAVFINPSGDHKDFLEYVYNDLVENTKWRDASFSGVELYDGRCQNLQVGINWGSNPPSFSYLPVCLKRCLKGYWGLTDDEIKELFWGRYDKHIINMKRLSKEQPYNLTESKEDIDKDFLDKVVNSLIDETKPTSGKHVSVFTPFFVPEVEKSWVLTAHRCREIGIVHPENYMVPSIISDHLKDVYSLRSIKEMDYVMNKYYFNIYNKYFRKFFEVLNDNRNAMNESSTTFGDNKKFLDKVANMIYKESQKMGKNSFPYDSTQMSFRSYVDNIYGLGYGEANYVFRKFRFLMGWDAYDTTKENPDAEDIDYRNTDDGYLNEANYTFGGNEKFLNKMVNFMVDDTELVELDEQPYIRIKFPFINYSGRRLPHKWFEAVPRFPFIEGMVDNYDLTDDEAEYVLEKYSDKLRSKVFSVRKQISDNVND
jgi:hypothetical protein